MESPTHPNATSHRLRSANWIARCICAVLATCGSPAFADHLVAYRGWFADNSGHATLADAKRARFEAFDGALSLGYGDEAIWLKVRIDPAADRATEPQAGDPRFYYLRVGEGYLDDIQIYDPEMTGDAPVVVGDRHPPLPSAMRSTVFLLPILKGTKPRDLYLRISSLSTRQIFVEVLTGLEARRSERVMRDYAIAYLTAIGMLLALGLLGLAVYRDALLATFVAAMATDAVMIIFRTGLTRYFWPAAASPWWYDLGTPLFISFSVVVSANFYAELLKEYVIPRWCRIVLHALLPLFALELAAMAIGYPTVMIRLIPYKFVLVNAVCVIAIARSRPTLSATPEQLLPKHWILAYFVALLAVVLASFAAMQGWTSRIPLAPSLAALHSLVAAFVLLVILLYRATAVGKKQQALATALQLSRDSAERERAHNEERERLFDMITHELKTSLAVIQLRLPSDLPGARDIDAAIQDIRNLVERCVQAGKMDADGLAPRLERRPLRPMLEEITERYGAGRVEMNDRSFREITTDPQLFSIMIGNLVENAIKYGPKDSPVKISVDNETRDSINFVTIKIANHIGNAGWPDATVIFRRFHRGPRAKRISGSGLGLYIVDGIVKVLGGDVRYEPTETEAVFSVRVPVQGPSPNIARPIAP